MPSEYIECIDCKTEFEFTENDQDFYERQGFTPPKRCKPCVKKKKARFNKGEDNREKFDNRR